MIYYYATDGGAGTKAGTSLANAAAIDAADANDIWSVINGLGALADDVCVKLCANAAVTVTAGAAWTKDATTTYRICLQGRNFSDTANAQVEMNANDGAFTVLTLTTADYVEINDVHFTNTSEAAGFHGLDIGADADNVTVRRCQASHCNIGFNQDTGAKTLIFRDCEAANNASHGFVGYLYTRHVHCESYDNGANGFYRVNARFCLAYGNGTVGIRGLYFCHGCAVYDNTSHGIQAYGDYVLDVVECVAVNNGGYGYYQVDATRAVDLTRCASYNNTSGRSNSGTGYWVEEGAIVLTAPPFVDAANGDFRPNTVAGGGALLRSIEYTYPAGLTKSYVDIGVSQHQPVRPTRPLMIGV